MFDRLKKQIDFIVEIDKIKAIFRRTKLFDGSRNENDAEHSWHLAIMAILLNEYSNEKIDILKVIKMVLIHDIVEIDAGDAFVYDLNIEEKLEKEKKAAKRIFGLLPDDQKNDFILLWQEFEEKKTPESKFAVALDRLEPIMQNYYNNGETWILNNIKYDRIIEINEKIKNGSSTLWEFVHTLIKEYKDKNLI